MITDTQTYIDAVENILMLSDDNPHLSPAEHNFVAWASKNISTPRQTAWEIQKGRRGSRSLHPALDIALSMQDATDEPLPFIA